MNRITMMGHLARHQINSHVSLGGLAFFQLFDLLPPPSWFVGLKSLLHLSFVSNRMIVLFFSIR